MNYKKIWLAALMVIASLILVSCGGATDQDKELLIGRWELSNIDSILSKEDLDIEEIEEYVELSMAMVFGSDGEFAWEVSLMMDFEGILTDLMAGEVGIEIEADQVNIQFTLGGTYEIASPGELLLNFDNDMFTVSPEQYCFSIAGLETCQSTDDFSEGFEDLGLYEGEGVYYEIDESSLTLWDDTCDYPEEQSCAAQFSK